MAGVRAGAQAPPGARSPILWQASRGSVAEAQQLPVFCGRASRPPHSRGVDPRASASCTGRRSSLRRGNRTGDAVTGPLRQCLRGRVPQPVCFALRRRAWPSSLLISELSVSVLFTCPPLVLISLHVMIPSLSDRHVIRGFRSPPFQSVCFEIFGSRTGYPEAVSQRHRPPSREHP